MAVFFLPLLLFLLGIYFVDLFLVVFVVAACCSYPLTRDLGYLMDCQLSLRARETWAWIFFSPLDFCSNLFVLIRYESILCKIFDRFYY